MQPNRPRDARLSSSPLLRKARLRDRGSCRGVSTRASVPDDDQATVGLARPPGCNCLAACSPIATAFLGIGLARDDIAGAMCMLGDPACRLLRACPPIPTCSGLST